MEFPEGANMKPPRDLNIPLGPFFFAFSNWPFLYNMNRISNNKKEEVIMAARKMMKKMLLIMLMLISLAIFLSLLAEAAPNYYPKDYSKIIEASRAEKGLLIYSVMAVDNWKPILAAFHKHYPWIEIKTLDLKPGEVMQRFIAEVETRIPTANFLVITPSGWDRLLKENRLMRYPSPEIPYLPKWSTRQETIYTFSGDPAVMVWNTKILPADMVPKGLEDLAQKVQKKPDFFRGRLTAYDDTGAYGTFGLWGLYKHHGEKLWTWLDILGPLTRPEASGGAQIEKILSGEYMLSYNAGLITLGVSSVKKAGKLIGWKWLEDGNIVLLRSLGIGECQFSQVIA
jgi:iron(III) transport system substrate-binding protein